MAPTISSLLGSVSCDTCKRTNHADDLTRFLVLFLSIRVADGTEAVPEPRRTLIYFLNSRPHIYPILTLSAYFTDRLHSPALL